MSEPHLTIGLVAIGRNEGERLKRCLRSIPDDVPVVYVDSASTDDSVAFARSMGATVVELDMRKPFSAARARNEGFVALFERGTTVTYVQFVDGDCELEASWLELAANYLSTNAKVAAVCGRRRERFPDASFYNRMCDDEWNTPVGQAAACGGDAMIRVDALEQVGTYDAGLIAGEEPELCQRLREAGWQIWRLDSPMTIHDADMHRFGQYWRRGIRSGFGYAQVLNKTFSGSGIKLYQREVASAIFWTIGVTLFAILGAALFGRIGLIVAPFIWTVQLLRLERRHGWTKAWHMLVGKIAETIGILRFLSARITGRDQGAIFYK